MSMLSIHNIPAEANGSIPGLAINPEGEMCLAELAGNQIVVRFSFDRGLTWQQSVSVPNATSSNTPAAAYAENRLYVAWTANDGSNILYYTFSDDNGQSFVPVIPVQDIITTEAPSMTGGPFAAVSFQARDRQVQMALLP